MEACNKALENTKKVLKEYMPSAKADCFILSEGDGIRRVTVAERKKSCLLCRPPLQGTVESDATLTIRKMTAGNTSLAQESKIGVTFGLMPNSVAPTACTLITTIYRSASPSCNKEPIAVVYVW
jgi:hypothetical protein